ncbi:arylamine N-acetyltransferase [Nannocystis sp. SCPEA4]|uniref:arylamine N-acetyltransferase family protein n=1 Tax=Nannocystis sp. SCPEA4 TaxID=2996787 RepID=UPI00226DFF51|nr:arylamine N-acetyltransferase [Nannocystis sp. SCPEA4]MCY1059185.1 arylamine N-acetyltransferase [Nannocystis sp. SCPEA4]
MDADLDAYFDRIRYDGPRDPTLATLQGIVAAHVATIPFENLDVLLGKPIVLDVPALLRKLVHDRRGGYCFENNGLLLHVLTALGFTVQPLSARVRLQRPREFIPPRTHMFVRVELDGAPWLADVGVGGLSPTAPLRLDREDEQATPHEPRRIVREDGRLFHQALLRGDDGAKWHDVCEFTLEQMPPIDREVANWFTSAHPQSHFRNRLVVARAAPDGGRHTILNTELTFRRRDGSAERHDIQNPEELLAILGEVFGLHFPAGTRFTCEGLPW